MAPAPSGTTTRILCHVLPERQKLFDIYLSLSCNSVFLASRDRVELVCRKFSRRLYIQCMEDQSNGVPIPLDFKLYILEWPEHAVFDCLWPGMPFEWNEQDMPFRRQGWNMLYYKQAQFFNLTLVDVHTDKNTKVAALPIWEGYHTDVGAWLVVGDHALRGQVVTTPASCSRYRYDTERVTVVATLRWTHGPCQSTRMPFLDWLSVSAKRFCVGMGEDYKSKIFFDESKQQWEPHRLDIKLTTYPEEERCGGHFHLYEPSSELVGRLERGLVSVGRSEVSAVSD